MTFERFYSIIRPHKATSFNTVKRAKVTIICIVLISVLFDIPHLFVTTEVGGRCIPIGKAMQYTYGQTYYWLTAIFNFYIPFVFLLLMNSVIIHTLRQRSNFMVTRSEGQGEGHASKPKSLEKQIYVTLLLVTFTFLILMTPSYAVFIYIIFVDYTKSPKALATYHILAHIAGQTYFTNAAINFFLYVISGKKFRDDLVKLFQCKVSTNANSSGVRSVTANTVA